MSKYALSCYHSYITTKQNILSFKQAKDIALQKIEPLIL